VVGSSQSVRARSHVRLNGPIDGTTFRAITTN